MEREIQWGVVGPGRIACRLGAEWPLVEGARLAGVASRDGARAEAYATEFSVARVYDNYAALFADPAIDIVYIAVPHNFHRALALEAIAAGKAVFCEKPMGMNAAEAEELAQAARARGVFLMEAVKTRFMPALRKVQEWIAQGHIGKPGLLQASFCFDVGGDTTGRHLNPELGGSALLDLGVYPLTLAEMLLGTEVVDTQATATLASTGVDATTAINLCYASGAVAQLVVSVANASGVHARLWGSKGFIDIPGFNQAISVSLHVDAGQVEFAQEGEATFRFEVEEANRCLRAGLLESPHMSLADSLRMARWQDAILAQIHGKGLDLNS